MYFIIFVLYIYIIVLFQHCVYASLLCIDNVKSQHPCSVIKSAKNYYHYVRYEQKQLLYGRISMPLFLQWIYFFNIRKYYIYFSSCKYIKVYCSKLHLMICSCQQWMMASMDCWETSVHIIALVTSSIALVEGKSLTQP